MVRLPRAALWRRKDVLSLGVFTSYEFRKAIQEGRLAGTVLPGRKYAHYRRDRVCAAFGIVPVNKAGEPDDVWAAEYGKLN